jgi:histidyl-tRNA synthetase
VAIQAIRGMRDVLPEEARRWRYVEQLLRRVLLGNGYEEIRLPMLEATELFSRGVGEATDIVEKEMYSLADRDGESVTLRPEGTAGCVRALIQRGLLYNQTQRVFYAGDMFRYERPQKGRYRQFYQLGAEAFGLPGPDVDAELIYMGLEFWRALGIQDHARLEINNLGSAAARANFKAALVEYLTSRQDRLDEDSQRRLHSNPLRILDSKSASTQEVLADAPSLPEFIDADSKAQFQGLRDALDALGLSYQVNPRLVRGLDYYTHTVFEWMTDSLGAQGTICAGGRYDGLVELLGGKATPGIGFAMGLERVLLLHEAVHGEAAAPAAEFAAAVEVYSCVLEPQYHSWALNFAQKLRDGLPGIRIRTHAGGGKLKNQLKRADQSGARVALMIGADEVQAGAVTVKFLRGDEEQKTLPIEQVSIELKEYFAIFDRGELGVRLSD